MYAKKLAWLGHQLEAICYIQWYNDKLFRERKVQRQILPYFNFQGINPPTKVYFRLTKPACKIPKYLVIGSHNTKGTTSAHVHMSHSNSEQTINIFC
jgi:hypothetical protein